MLLLRMIFGNLEIWQWLMMAAVLIPCTIKDIHTKRINGYICLAGILAAIAMRERVLKEDNLSILVDALPGVLLYVVAFLTKEKIGKGDAIALIFVGLVSGVTEVLSSLFIALTVAAVLSGVLLLLKKAGKDTRIPFIPFLSFGVIAGGLI